MTDTTNYIGVRVKPETVKTFNELTTNSGINKSHILRQFIFSYIVEHSKKNSTELMQNA